MSELETKNDTTKQTTHSQTDSALLISAIANFLAAGFGLAAAIFSFRFNGVAALWCGFGALFVLIIGKILSSGQSPLRLALSVLPGAIVAIAVFLVIPSFQEVFTNVGADLPLETKILMATYRWWGLVVLTTLCLWLVWPNSSNLKASVALAFGIISAGFLFLFAVWAAYAPIFQLGAIV